MSASETITATYTRTQAGMKKYINIFQERAEKGIKINPFIHSLETGKDMIREFNHWFIMENQFPYDAFAEVNHMICTKRQVPFDWHKLTQEERSELDLLKSSYIAEHYDVVYENLPSGQTQSGHFHLHLLKLKRTSLEEFFKN